MIRLGATASQSHMALCRDLEKLFHRHNIDFDWVLYSSYDAMVDAFVRGEIDLAWNGPLSYVKIKRALNDPCQNLVMRDVDLNFTTQFITHKDSDIATVEDLPGKRFALGSRSSVQAGLLAYHYLKESGINPRRDLSGCTFHEERPSGNLSDERDVVQQVHQREYDAGAVSRRTLEEMEEKGNPTLRDLRVFWTSPGYSHCCFTARREMDPEVSRSITDVFLSVDGRDSVGKAVLEAEACKTFVPGVTEGWETLEKIAEEEGLI